MSVHLKRSMDGGRKGGIRVREEVGQHSNLDSQLTHVYACTQK